MEIQDAKYGAWPATTGLKSENVSASDQSFNTIFQEKISKTEINEYFKSQNKRECITNDGNKVNNPYRIPTSETGAITIDDLMAKRDDMMDAFQNQTMNLFGQHGVDISREIELDCDEAGNVIVANNHPDKEKIERIFQDNPELANLYRGISATQSIIQAYEESAGFREMYAVDPKQAVETYRYLFDDNRDVSDQFAIKIVDGQVVVV